LVKLCAAVLSIDPVLIEESVIGMTRGGMASVPSTCAAGVPLMSPVVAGVVFSVEDPNLGSQAAAGQAAPALMPSSLPLPPPDLGPLSFAPSNDTAAIEPLTAIPSVQPLTPAAPEAATPSPVKVELPPEGVGPMDLRQAASNGDARAQFEVAAIYTEGRAVPQDYKAAATWYERAAAQGFAPAQYRLGSLYESGNGVDKDLNTAKLWYERAAEAGNRMSMHNLAALYAGGQLGKQQFDSAAKWFEEAADRGLTDSQFNLGILSEHGLGIPQDLSAAYQWFALAAKGGDEEAAKHRDLVKAQLDPAALVAAKQAVAAWKPKEAVSDANGVEELPEWSEGSATPNTALVSRAQNLLNKLGYDAGVADGLIGAQTRDAIKSFERKNGLEETGKVTIQLVAKLERLTS
jgi:localization factor PodJL